MVKVKIAKRRKGFIKQIDFGSKHKLIITTIFIIIGMLITTFFKYIEVGRVYTHLYYIPIIIACLWWKKKGLLVSVFLAIFLITFSLIMGNKDIIIYDILRAVMFIVIGIFVVLMSTALSKSQVKMKESHIKLEQAYDELNKNKEELQQKSDELVKAKKELEAKVEDLEKFHNIVVGRELKMAELKKKLKNSGAGK